MSDKLKELQNILKEACEKHRIANANFEKYSIENPNHKLSDMQSYINACNLAGEESLRAYDNLERFCGRNPMFTGDHRSIGGYSRQDPYRLVNP